MKTIQLFIILTGLLLAGQITLAQQHQKHQHGSVNFDVSCNEEAGEFFNNGLAILHHMMYEQAESEFNSAIEADSECAMAYWGIAMSIIHPLWGERPAESDLKRGLEAVETAKRINPQTEHEKAWIAAVEGFYRDWETTSYLHQLIEFKKGFEDLYTSYPDNIDAAAFYALTQIATAPKDDPTFSRQEKAGAMLEELHKLAPEHPGLFHYIIHAYDNTVLAEKAVDVAHGYDKIAPDVPHALHMPSHIFVRLGYWPEVIDWNRRSADSALRQPVGDQTSGHYAHALDYLVYAYLQRGEDNKARKVVEDINMITNFQQSLGVAYAVAAVSARYSLERERWEEAANLPVQAPNMFPLEKYPATESILHFARGIGAARSGQLDKAQNSLQELERVHERLIQSGEIYWAILTDAQRLSVDAWMAFSKGDHARALDLMKEAADREDSVDKHPVTPGHILPARELLGDMLVELNMLTEAHQAYEISLKLSANRLRSLYGAGKTAELNGDAESAKLYYSKLVETTSKEEIDRPIFGEVARFMTTNE